MKTEITWKRAKPLADYSQVMKFEAFFAFKLPSDFIIFLRGCNAAKPAPRIFDTALKKGRVFSALISFDAADEINIFNTIADLRSAGFPEQLVPFAADPFGNYICFDSRRQNAVVFWDHENNTTEAVADSFAQFFELLHDA